jgi:hypothetical protein
MTGRIDALFDALESDQPADFSIERSPRVTEVKLGRDTIARVDERREELVVYMPADVRSTLQAAYQGARRDPAGLAFDLTNDGQAAAGLALLRRRATIERMGWQYREGSP